jgi:hypothetical protein
MVVHWYRTGGEHATRSMLINGLGTACTAVALAIVLISKFLEGAWIIILLIPTLLAAFVGVRAHYRTIARELATDAPLDATGLKPPVVLVPMRGWSAITRKALRFALEISADVYALHIVGEEADCLEIEDAWTSRVREPALAAGVCPPRLIVIFSPYRRLHAPLKQAIADLQHAHPTRDLAVIVPELVVRRWYHNLLHNQTAAVIKAYLLFSGFRRVMVINVPWYLSD